MDCDEKKRFLILDERKKKKLELELECVLARIPYRHVSGEATSFQKCSSRSFATLFLGSPSPERFVFSPSPPLFCFTHLPADDSSSGSSDWLNGIIAP
ncbi:hypothetical protein CDAR_552311 [Caerostris darwini]|uniref:Uncharacterized protein n=1 Tax=Caerostris darwini TaxID=1538125 RepID=A0AAV4NJM3_9ARAC|nr:hypothetical protein CDAR_552311 [Caerostris darwini]